MNSMNPLTTQEEAFHLIQNAKQILIAPSSPDGDSIGSALAMMLVLRKLGKEVMVVSTNEVPDYLKFLPYTEEMQDDLPTSKDFVISLKTDEAHVDHLKYEVEHGKINIIVTPKHGLFQPHHVSVGQAAPQFDLVITVDTGDLVQLGDLYENNKALFEHGTVLNIDHHASNGKFGSHNFLNYDVAATTQMLTPLLMAFEKTSGKMLIDEDVATLLLTGIVTDTGSFQHSNTSPEAFEVAADLLERGARQQEIIKHIFKTKSLETLKLWGRVLSKIQHEGELVYSTITQQDLSDTGATADDSGGIIDELMASAPGSEVVLLLKEKEPGFVSGSLRAPGSKADVSAIAQMMGGGGHKKAAGFRIREKSMPEALEIAKQNIFAYLSALNGQTHAFDPNSAPLKHLAPNTSGQLTPGQVAHPAELKPNSSIPVPSPGGEDLLLKDFRQRQDGETVNPANFVGNTQAQTKVQNEKRIRENAVRFFQDADGQEAPKPGEPTVGDVLGGLNPFQS